MSNLIEILPPLSGQPATDHRPIAAIAAIYAPSACEGNHCGCQRKRWSNATSGKHCQSRSRSRTPADEPAGRAGVSVDNRVGIIKPDPFPPARRPRHDLSNGSIGQRERANHDHVSKIHIDADGQFDAIMTARLAAIMNCAPFPVARLFDRSDDAADQQQSNAAEMGQQGGMPFTTDNRADSIPRHRLAGETDVRAHLSITDRCHAVQSLLASSFASTAGRR